jgi:hypothetical protein
MTIDKLRERIDNPDEFDLAVQEATPYLSVTQVREHVARVQQIVRDVLIEGEVVGGKIVKDGHYSKLPGCGNKKVLLKPGAEKLCLAFNLVPRYQFDIVKIDEDENTPPGHRDYEVTCELYNRVTGTFVGQGMGSCSTLEKKYRYRTRYEGRDRITEENPCLADVYNTAKKVGCKRSFVHAVIQTLAVGDIFMQDVEDMDPKDISGYEKPRPPMRPPQSKSSTVSGPTKKQMGLIQAKFGEYNSNLTSEEKRGIASEALGREVSSMTELTNDDVSKLVEHIGYLVEMADETKNDDKPPF